MTPAPVYVLAAVRAVLGGDWALARWCHHQAVLARVAALLDDGHAVEIASLTAHEHRRRLDSDERLLASVTTAIVRSGGTTR